MNRTLLRYITLTSGALMLLGSAARSQGSLVPEPAGAASLTGAALVQSAPGDEAWNAGIGTLNIDGPVYVAESAPNGDLYIGGSFTSINGTQMGRIARWDGSAWHQLGAGISGGTVYAIAFLGNDVYVGGNFTETVSGPASNIARWDGSAWHSLGDITVQGVDSTVLALAAHNGDLYVGGNFTYTGNQDQVNYIARYTPSDQVFHTIDDGTRAGMDGGVAALIFTPNGDLYAGGGFTKAGGTNASRVAKWSGSAWSALGAGAGAAPGSMTPYVRTLAFRDSIVIAGGTFTFAGGKPTKYVARWTLASNSWGGLAGDGVNGTDSDVYKVMVAPSGRVYVTGNFSNAGGHPASRVGYWILPGPGGWSTLGSGIDATGYALAAMGNKIWVGGAFAHAGANEAHYLAQWDESLVSGVEDINVSSDAMKLEGMRWHDGIGEIRFAMPGAAHATIEIVNMRGEVVATPVAGLIEAGEQRAVWNAEGMPAGIYLCRLQSGAHAIASKIILAR